MGEFCIKYGTFTYINYKCRYYKIRELLKRKIEGIQLRLKRKRQLRGQLGTCGILGPSLVKSYAWEAKAGGWCS